MKVKEIDWDNASDPTPNLDYNCVGFAVGDLKWWEPLVVRGGRLLNPYAYWPSEVPPKATIGAFVAAIATRGFVVCTKSEWDSAECRKIVLYHDGPNFTHAMLFVSERRLMSKFGEFSDFEHNADAAECDLYGTGRVYMVNPGMPKVEKLTPSDSQSG